ncbi:hypothetical protein RDI58_024313 [Solanum bulbocastanum]|uniref:Uncharacterized protein n=1 Tax=Solanum bulbocastanum TaxID=147425 RepID=A0AAN8Y2U7_SOLBU
MSLEFERKKQEILAAQNALDGEGEASQLSKLSEMDTWVQSISGKKKGRVKGLGILGIKAIKINFPKDIDEIIKPHLNASNADLYAQLQNDQHKNKKMRKELDVLVKHVYKKSFSNDLSSQEDKQVYENESDDDYNSMIEKDFDTDNVNESDHSYDSIGW